MKKEFNLNGFILKEKFLPKETIQQILLEIHKVFRNKLQYDEFDFHTTKNGLVEPKDLFEYYKKIFQV